MEIVTPIQLAKLPKPAQAEGKAQFGPVYGIRSGVKRKRQELCAAVDGDSLGIYEVGDNEFPRCKQRLTDQQIQSGRLLSSYPVPPTSTFACAPYSLRTKKDGNSYLRRTYCVLRKTSLEVQYYEENIEDVPHKAPSPVSAELEGAESTVVYLEVMQPTTSGDVILVQQNGYLTLFSQGLQRQKAHVRLQLASEQAGQIQVLAAQWLSAEDAARSVLKQRNDIGGALSEKESLLVVAYQGSQRLASGLQNFFGVGVWSLTHATETFGRTSVTQVLFTHQIHLDRKSTVSDKVLASFGLRASTLSVTTSRGHVTYDLTSLTPQRLSEVTPGTVAQTSFLPLSSSLIMSATPNALEVHNARYQSLQANIDLGSGALKRKRNNLKSAFSDVVHLVAFFPQLERVIACRKTQLLAIDLKTSTSSVDRPIWKVAASLADNVGRGITNKPESEPRKQVKNLDIGTINPIGSTSNGAWLKVRKTLEEEAGKGAVKEFEDVALAHLAAEEAGLPDAHSLLTNSPLLQTKAGFMISQIFYPIIDSEHVDKSAGDYQLRMRVNIPAKRVLAWLIQANTLNADGVRKALQSAHKLPNNVKLLPDALCEALASADPSLTIVSEYLHQRHLGPSELCGSIKFLLMQWTIQVAIEAGVARENEYPEGAPWSVAPKAIPISLNFALERFGKLSRSTISSQIQDGFPRDEVVAVVQWLRQQLYRDGYTTSIQSELYPTPPNSGHGSPIPDGSMQRAPVKVSLDSIVNVLSGCIDAIGPFGLMSSELDDDVVSKIIPEIKSEVSRAELALEEAAYLQGILRETLRYTASTQQKYGFGTKPSISSPENLNQQRSGMVVTLYTEPQEEDDAEGSSNVLPLSLRKEDVINPIKVRKGNGRVTKRSVRETAMLESRHKGAYSFERIIL